MPYEFAMVLVVLAVAKYLHDYGFNFSWAFHKDPEERQLYLTFVQAKKLRKGNRIKAVDGESEIAKLEWALLKAGAIGIPLSRFGLDGDSLTVLKYKVALISAQAKFKEIVRGLKKRSSEDSLKMLESMERESEEYEIYNEDIASGYALFKQRVVLAHAKNVWQQCEEEQTSMGVCRSKILEILETHAVSPMFLQQEGISI